MIRPVKPIRLIALDVDGTLLDPDEVVRPRVRAAIKAAREAGVLVTLATGRRFIGASEIAADLELRLPLILHGGAVIQDSASAAVIYQDPLEPDTVAAVVETVVRHQRSPIVYESPANGGRLYAGPPDFDPEAMRQYDALRGPFERMSFADLGKVHQVLSIAVLADPGGLDEVAAAVARVPETQQILSAWHLTRCDALEIFRKGCSKATALAHLAEAHHVGMDEVMAIGDGLNDCELLGAAGWGVAMGNACAEACAKACIQVGTNEQDGVAEAIERWVLARA